jgi:hypothetical protein
VKALASIRFENLKVRTVKYVICREAQKMLMRRILGFLVDQKTKPEIDSEATIIAKPENNSLKQSPISQQERDFVLVFMFWCAHNVFKCIYEDWFLNYNLKPTAGTVGSLPASYIVRTVRQNRRLEYSEIEMDKLHARLVRNALVMIVALMHDKTWDSNRFNLTALCITVAEVTEEISFIFNAEVDTAVKIFDQAVQYGWKDKGVLYKLCTVY